MPPPDPELQQQTEKLKQSGCTIISCTTANQSVSCSVSKTNTEGLKTKYIWSKQALMVSVANKVDCSNDK